ncbi:MAG: NAD(P)-binding domain-containing protein [Candidatus Dormibacteria bacterium]|jgi:3-hydroxyisobutyrate dehydrogenase-like beta-hydroxyacid dehydrogenase
MSERIAILGTGRMGSAIARCLVQFEPTLWNRTRSRAEQVGVGRVAASPADAARAADLVVLSLTGADAVRAALGGPDGALTAAHGQLFIEMSTSGPAVIEELAAQLHASGSTLIDAPIMGAPTVVLRGAAAILAGGAPDDIARARPVLELLGEVRHVGPLGSGARLKLVANSMLAVVTSAAAELQVAGEAAGLDGEEVFWVLARLAPVLESRRAGYLRRTEQPTLFALRDLLKDLDLARELFGQSGAQTPLTARARTIVEEACGEGADLDIAAVIRRYTAPPTR